MVTITINDLRKEFGSVVALDNINLKIEAGEIFFLLGPSGCGKTTLLRHIAGFYAPTRGSIYFGDQEVTNLPPRDRNTGMMFQSYALWPHMNVSKNVAFGLEQQNVEKREIEKRVGEALDSVKMLPYAKRKINELSGGQQQRVALARALVVRPKCLLLDEPLSNLDAKLRLEMRGEIRRSCKEFGLTAVYVTHDQKEALSIADRMAIMKSGNILQVGGPAQVYRNPFNVDVATFIGEANLIKGVIEGESSYDGEYLVATEEGAFRGRITDPNWTPTVGQQVTVSIRPEGLLPSDGPGNLNVITGKLSEIIYLGETAQYTVSSDSGNQFNAAELNPISTWGEIGDSFHLRVESQDVTILRSS